MKDITLNLKLFDEGTAGTAGTAGSTTESSGDGRGTASAAQIVYGKQAQNTDGTENTGNKKEPENPNTENNNTTEKKTFAELIASEEYSEDYKKHMENIVKDRHKDYKAMQERVSNYETLMQKLAARYDVDAEDIHAVMSAMDKDNGYLEEKAVEQGMSVEAFKRMKDMEVENTMLKRQNTSIEHERAVRERFDAMIQEVPEIKKLYPAFDLSAELKNPTFVQLIDNNIPLKAAYEVIHRDEIMQGALQYAVQTTKKQISDSIQSNGNRAPEGGGAAGAVIVKNDVTKLTKKDRAEIVKRVSDGEKIVF